MVYLLRVSFLFCVEFSIGNSVPVLDDDFRCCTPEA